MITNQYDPSRPEHTVTCSRLKCSETGTPVHQAGMHLDQRSEFYDGPDILLRATSMYVRGSARKIISEAPGLTPEVVDLVTYIDFLGQQVAHVSVDRDHKVREAMARSGDCEAHGTEIRLLGEQLHAISESDRRNDQGRVAMLGLLFELEELIRQHEQGRLPGDLTVGQLVKALKGSADRARRAHGRAWKR